MFGFFNKNIEHLNIHGLNVFRTMSNVCILGYWDIRGLAEPIRLLLEHVEANYEDRR